MSGHLRRGQLNQQEKKYIDDTAAAVELDASAIVSGVIDSARLPSYVDDVLEYANLAALPVTGETGIIYITLDDNKTYRWTGSVYVEVSSGGAVTIGSGYGVATLYAISNVDSASDGYIAWSRVGNAVTFGIWMLVDATAGGSNAIVDIDLPVASNLAEAFSCIGTTTTSDGLGGQLYGNSSDNRIRATVAVTSTSGRFWFCSGVYIIE